MQAFVLVGFRVYRGLGFRVWGDLGLRAWGLGFGVSLGIFRVRVLGLVPHRV